MIEPKWTKDTFVSQCRAIVGGSVPISIQQWNKSKDDPEVSYVQDKLKGDLWTSLMTNFSLPLEEDLNNPVIEPKVKKFAIKKMADLFRNWNKVLNTKFVDKGKTPEFTGQFEKTSHEKKAGNRDAQSHAQIKIIANKTPPGLLLVGGTRCFGQAMD